MSKIYYGSGPLPKNQRHPTMKEAVDAVSIKNKLMDLMAGDLTINELGKKKPLLPCQYAKNSVMMTLSKPKHSRLALMWPR